MSQENVDRLIEVMEAYNRVVQNPDALDASALTEWLGMLDPEIRFEPQQSALEGGYIGHAGATQWLADMGAHFKEGEVRLADVRGHEGRALALGTLRFTARRSGIETELPVAIVASFRDGLVTKLRDYGDKEEALEAVGLSELAMSQENVEVVRRVLDAMNAGNVEDIKRVVAPNAEWRPVLTAGGDLERPVYRGPAGIAQYVTDMNEVFDGTEVHVEELDSTGPKQVLFGGRVTTRGRESGAPIEERIWAVWELRDGKVVRGTAYRAKAEALEAVGLSE